MSIGDSITLIGCLAGLMAALPALLIFLNMIFTRTTERAAYRLAHGSKLPFITGLIALVIVGLPSWILISMGSIFQFVGTLMFLGLLLWAFAGLGAVARLVGLRISNMADRGSNSFFEVLIGAVVLAFAVAFPLVGWAVILPVGLIVGIGALTLALVNRAPDDSDRTYYNARVNQPAGD
jgi:hypothetical protein